MNGTKYRKKRSKARRHKEQKLLYEISGDKYQLIRSKYPGDEFHQNTSLYPYTTLYNITSKTHHLFSK